jgi:nicotinamide-nucleotide amidase
MKVEILTIGDEVLSGAITDTNAAWLGDQVWSRGLDLLRHLTVADEPDRIAAGLLESAGRADVVVVTGGLGPTIDDITVATAARAFGLPLELHEPSLEAMRAVFARMGREMSRTNLKQAMLPRGAVVIGNPVGTAPGCRVEHRGTWFVFLPGVPAEMKRQFADTVLPWLWSLLPRPTAFEARILRCFGMPEATIQEEVADVDLKGLDLAFRPGFPEILLKVSGRGRPGEGLAERVAAVSDALRACLGDVVYAEGDAAMAEVVVAALLADGRTVATAESGTGGSLAAELGAVAGGGAAFAAGRVLATTADAPDVLAERARSEAGADWGLAVVGGPAGGIAEGATVVALAGEGAVARHDFRFPGRGGSRFRRVAAWAAMDVLRRAVGSSGSPRS